MGNDISQRAAVKAADGGRGGKEFEEVLGFPNQRFSVRRFSPPPAPLVTMSLVAPLVGGPVGSLAAIVFGWAARHEPPEVMSTRRRRLAVLGMTMGFVFTCAWAAVIAHVTMSLEKRMRAENEQEEVASGSIAPGDAVSTTTTPPSNTNNEPVSLVPRATTAHREGLVVVVDVGTSVPSLSEEVAKERVEAARNGDLLVLMTTRAACPTCRHVAESLRHPLMQTALAHVRLVRIDADVFEEDLSNMKIPHDNLPGFFLLAPDLFPRDGIDGGEWTTDSTTNVSSVLSAFVRGKYAARRRAWQPVAENRLRL